jgi:hypothetical protein
MADFTSSLYLDMRHPSRTIGAWPQLTTGSQPRSSLRRTLPRSPVRSPA